MSEQKNKTLLGRSLWIGLILGLMVVSALNWPDGIGRPRIAAADNTVTVELVEDGESAGINFTPTNVSFDPPSCNVVIGTGDICTDILTVQNTGIEFTYTISAWVDTDAIDAAPEGPEGDELVACFNIHLTQDAAAGQPIGDSASQGPFGPLPLAVGGVDIWRLDANIDDDNACQGQAGTLFIHVSAEGVAAPPTATPTETPTEVPTATPTETPTEAPTATPTQTPTAEPATPTASPTTVPPTATPTDIPAVAEVEEPTVVATLVPTLAPTVVPTTTPQTPEPEPTGSDPNLTDDVLGEITTPTPTGTSEPDATPTFTPTPTPTTVPPPTAEPTQEVASARVELEPKTFLNEIPGLSNISTSLAVVGTNLLLALIALLILLLATTMFNATVKENAAEIDTVMRRFSASPQVGAVAGAFGWLNPEEAGTHPLLSRVKPGLIVLLTAAIYAALDPDFGLNNETLVLVVALIAGIALVTFLYEGGQVLWSTRRIDTPAAMRLYPVAILIAVLCVALTKVTNLHPGIIFGFVTAAAIFPRTALSKREEGLLVAVPLVGLMMVSFAAFLLVDPLRDFSQSNPGVWATLPETIAVAMFVGGAESALLILIPFTFNDGEKVWAWNKGLWFLLAVPATFAFFHVLINEEDLSGLTQDTNTVRLLAICLVVLGVSVVTWGYFWWRRRTAEA